MKCPECGTPLIEQAKFCRKCGKRVAVEPSLQNIQNTKTSTRTRSSNQGGKFTSSHPTQKNNKPTGFVITLLTVLIIALACVIVFFIAPMLKDAAVDMNNMENKVSQAGKEMFYAANSKCIEFETHNVVMNGDSEGIVTLTVQLPDYTKLYNNAYASKNPDQFMLEALQSGEYDVCVYEITAKVTIDNGEQVIHSDEAISMLLEQELAKATNALLEAQK